MEYMDVGRTMIVGENDENQPEGTKYLTHAEILTKPLGFVLGHWLVSPNNQGQTRISSEGIVKEGTGSSPFMPEFASWHLEKP